MGYRLRIPAEIGDWLAGLRESEPSAAAEVAASLVALMDAADPGRLTLVAHADPDNGEPEPDDPLAAADAAYQDLVEDLQHLRQQLSVAATERKEAELRIGELRARSGADPALLAAAVRDRERAEADRARFAARSQSAQAVIDQYRTSKETAKAMFTAAQAAREVHESINAGSGGPSEDRELADLNLRADQAAARLRGLVARVTHLRRSIQDAEEDGDGGRGAARSARERPAPPDSPELMQLKADPLGRDIRILFAEDPAGTATLLTILEGSEAIADDWDDATTAAAMLLEVIRDDGWPPYAEEPDGGGDEFADSVSFRQRFFPDQSGAIAARAAEIGGHASLASLRERGGLTVAELAAKAGLTERRVIEIEAEGLRHATLHELTAYLRTVRSTLQVTASVDGEQLRLV
jgi:phage shock protein A